MPLIANLHHFFAANLTRAFFFVFQHTYTPFLHRYKTNSNSVSGTGSPSLPIRSPSSTSSCFNSFRAFSNAPPKVIKRRLRSARFRMIVAWTLRSCWSASIASNSASFQLSGLTGYFIVSLIAEAMASVFCVSLGLIVRTSTCGR